VIFETAAGNGPFAMAGNSVTEHILGAQVFSAMCYLTALGLAAAWKERTLAQERSRETETRYRAIVETANDAFVGMGADGRISDWNAAAEAMFGWSREEAIGSRLSDSIIPERYRHLGALAQHFETNGAHSSGRTVEFFALHRDGHEFSVDVTTWPVRVGKEQTFSAFVRDITARKSAEEEVTIYAAELERANREVEEFAYVASHDLQEPLRNIRAFGDLFVLRFGSALGEEARDYLGRIQGAAARAQHLMDDFLAFSRVATRRSELIRVDLGEITRELVSEFESELAETGGRIEVGELPELEADRVQMRELFRNLIDNGLKFHRPGEPPVVRVSKDDVVNGSYRIVVEDSGIGFEEQYADRIFTTFERLHPRGKYEGTGMGLALCRKIVQRHGGTISATSVPGEGSRFAVTLPMLQAVSARLGRPHEPRLRVGEKE
jgi:PAS domain S-box-containing protein